MPNLNLLLNLLHSFEQDCLPNTEVLITHRRYGLFDIEKISMNYDPETDETKIIIELED